MPMYVFGQLATCTNLTVCSESAHVHYGLPLSLTSHQLLLGFVFQPQQMQCLSCSDRQGP